jgi:hypothetical protein
VFCVHVGSFRQDAARAGSILQILVRVIPHILALEAAALKAALLTELDRHAAIERAAGRCCDPTPAEVIDLRQLHERLAEAMARRPC